MLWALILWPPLALGLSLALAWPLARRLALTPSEQLVASVVLSLVALFFLSWAIYVGNLPSWLLWSPPLLGAAGLLSSFDALRHTGRDPAVRSLVLGHLKDVWVKR